MAKPRLPNNWTAEGDETLRKEVESTLHESATAPEDWDWCQIAEKLSGLTNKDFRKRWYNAMAGDPLSRYCLQGRFEILTHKHIILCRKLRRQVQDKQHSKEAGPSDENPHRRNKYGMEEGNSDQEDIGLGWAEGLSQQTSAQSITLGSRPTNSTIGDMHAYTPFNIQAAHGVILLVNDPLSVGPVCNTGNSPFLDVASDTLMKISDSPFLDFLITDPGNASTSWDNRSLPSTGVDCAMLWECPGDIETSYEDIVAVGTFE
ncbi:hypothetical protein P168DRAFT_322470 [Aspergillus campestris IBT 28561]|uniref:Myb-like domain-containing protein n=1 Tax=Aspergillus campestris (strain IBT 28561) TaxID=1392248 RepID=A0A2I1CQU9_ASPC2|nr:uncharacterized protein P168DRAFT_322470 [Aspergillus campestris IBT 28561]PKY00005.1 hypothetical protein P168DRAFT_322470 [Aspergillus campestris IBT 28561]